MPRKIRFYLPGIATQVVQRGLDRQAVFVEEEHYQSYLNWLAEAAEYYGCAVHSYVLMPNHIHLLLTPETKDSISSMMQYIGRQYVPYFNSQYGDSGTIWQGRYKASMIQAEKYLFDCMRYIESNSIRAGLSASPRNYRWSSYRINAEGKQDAIITPHELYKGLGRTIKKRQQAYRILFKSRLNDELLSDIRAAWRTGTPLGNVSFRKMIERRLKCKVGYAKRGRPRKS